MVRRTLVALLAAGTVAATGPVADARPRSASPAVLILHDVAGPYGILGERYAIMLDNLLGHFPVDVTVEPVTRYNLVRAETFAAVFYIGSTYDEPSWYPQGSDELGAYTRFLADTAAGLRPTIWLGFNLWRLAWMWDPVWGDGFRDRFGVSFWGYDETKQYNRVEYKGIALDKGVVRHASPGADVGACAPEPEGYDCAGSLSTVAIDDPARASVLAWATSTVTSARAPYITRAGTLWIVGDIPFSYASEEDRYLAFADLLHDMLGIDHVEDHRALVRLEDVNPTSRRSDLESIESVLDERGIPFAIATVPFFEDPTGFYTGGVPESARLSETEAGPVLARLAAEGASIVQHGTTHQWSGGPNPYNGVSTDDFEFFRVRENPDHSLVFAGPIPGDSARWAKDRISAGKRELAAAGVHAFAWEAPHYAASKVDHAAISSVYPVYYGRALYFDSGGAPVGQFFPFVTVDVHGQTVVPENLGDVSPEEWKGYGTSLPADLIRRATAARVVRDGFASFFFHPYLDPTYLEQTVDGIRQLGYTFVSACAVVAKCAMTGKPAKGPKKKFDARPSRSAEQAHASLAGALRTTQH